MVDGVDKRKRLGKGLRALIPGGVDARDGGGVAEAGRGMGRFVREVAVEAIEPNPEQPRKSFREEELSELAESIRRYGVLQPLLVRREGERFVLVTGERRLRAAIAAGLKTVPVIEGDEKSAEKSLRIALVENIQRVDLNPVEEARAFAELQEKHNLTQEQIAAEVGKSRPYIANALRLLKLSADILRLLSVGALSTGHAKVLLELDDENLQKRLAETAANKSLSVAELSRLVKAALKEPPAKRQSFSPGPDIKRIIAELENKVGARISIKMKSRTKGEIVLHYASLDELERILKQLKK
ncbi:MAG: ParB/RepB/Spo0J family partition protein [Myxococcota bacterium]